MNTFVHGDDNNKVMIEDVQLPWIHNNVRKLCKKDWAEQSKSWWTIVSNDTFDEIIVPYPNTQLLNCKYILVDNSERSMHVKTAADSSQLCQQWLGCRTEPAADRAFPLDCKWKIALQSPPDCNKLQGSSKNRGNRSTTVALQKHSRTKIHPN